MIIFFVQKISSAYYVCYIYSNVLQTSFIMKANSLIPDQTAPWEQSDLGPYCLQCRPPKYIKAEERADDNYR